MATKKTTPKKTTAKKAAAKAPTKKAAEKKAPAKKVAQKKTPAKKAVAKKVAPKKSAQPKRATKAAVNFTSTADGVYTTSTTSTTGNISISVTPTVPVQEIAKVVTSSVVKMNDVKNSSLRKRMMAWFKRS